MAFSWVGFREAYDEDMARQREDRLRLDERAQRMLPAIMERRNMERQAAREAATKLSYLEQRGLDTNSLDALYGDQAALDAVFQEASRGKWVDYDADQLNARIRFVGGTVEAGSSWRDSLAAVDDSFGTLDFENITDETLQGWNEYLYSPAQERGRGVAEIVTDQTPDWMDSSQREQYKFQEEMYDRGVLELANRELAALRESGAGPDVIAEAQRRIEGYNENPTFKTELREIYGDTFLTQAEESGQYGAALVGIETNPLIFTPQGEPAATSGAPEPTVELPTVTTSEEYSALPSGTEYLDPNGVRRRKS